MSTPSYQPWIKLREEQPNVGQHVLLGDASDGAVIRTRWPQTTGHFTHWLPIPEIPKPDPFKEWWNSLPASYDSHFCRIIDNHHTIDIAPTRSIWDAALKSLESQP